MDTTKALKLALYYRALSTLSLLLGGAVVGAGFWYGVVPVFRAYAANFPAADAPLVALEALWIPGVLLMAVGVGVWQLGSTAAYVWTLGAAVEAAETGRAEGTGDRRGARSDGEPAVDGAGPAGHARPGDDGGSGGSGEGTPDAGASTGSEDPATDGKPGIRNAETRHRPSGESPYERREDAARRGDRDGGGTGHE